MANHTYSYKPQGAKFAETPWYLWEQSWSSPSKPSLATLPPPHFVFFFTPSWPLAELLLLIFMHKRIVWNVHFLWHPWRNSPCFVKWPREWDIVHDLASSLPIVNSRFFCSFFEAIIGLLRNKRLVTRLNLLPTSTLDWLLKNFQLHTWSCGLLSPFELFRMH